MFKGQWIWENSDNRKDEYIELYSSFSVADFKNILFNVSADTDYMLYINGELADFGQYPDYPNFKAYNSTDISEFVKCGVNHLAIIAYHSGESSSTHYPTASGIIFDIVADGEALLSSSEDILSRISTSYISYREKYVTGQMGYGYACDLTDTDNWMLGEGDGFHKSVAVDSMPSDFVERPIEKLRVDSRCIAEIIKSDDKSTLYDLGCEVVGFPRFMINAKSKCKLILSWGEHIIDGDVRRIIGDRDFSLEFTVPAGETEFYSTMLRIGARYIKLETDGEIEIEYCSLCPSDYPLNILDFKASNPLRQKIYDTSVRTLELCMHDHYEDCPWREQALYCMDSRNQMICGYYAFREYKFARASLELMCNDPVDGLLTICFPCDNALKIPSFSLHWFTQMREYAQYSGDNSLCEKYYGKLMNVLDTFLDREENGLIPIFFEDSSFWNFYEWSDGLEGSIEGIDGKSFDLLLNCLVSTAMQNMDLINARLGKPSVYSSRINKINEEIVKNFYNSERGIFADNLKKSHYSELGNSLAILCGAADEKMSKEICEVLTRKDNGLVSASLSMMTFLYDALIKTDEAKYKEYILSDIDSKYGNMLDCGATAFWETLVGAEDFGGAGSLCHGWSAMPVYYYHILGEGQVK